MWTCEFCQAEMADDVEVCWNCNSRREDQLDKSAAPILTPANDEADAYELPIFPCVRCGSTKLIPRGRLKARSASFGGLPIELNMKDDFWGTVFQGNDEVDLLIVVCGECGLVTFEARNARIMWKHYERWLAKEHNE